MGERRPKAKRTRQAVHLELSTNEVESSSRFAFECISIESKIMDDKFNEEDTRQYFDLIQNGNSDAPVELRALNFKDRTGNTFSGYFNDPEKFIEAVRIASKFSGGIYMPINVLNPALIARRSNRATEYAKLTTADCDIIRRQFIPIDLDPIRSSGVSSTDEQHEAALNKARTIHKWIIKEKWPEPIFCDSGNGAHLLLPIDLPNNEESTVFVQNMLYGLHENFSDDVIVVYTSVHNAARIMRVPGTMNCKGDNHPKYPHRMAKILSIPKKQEAKK